MNFLIIASTLILATAIAMASSKSKKNTAAIEQEFWQRERAANSTRRKPLDDLNYIKLPMEISPWSFYRTTHGLKITGRSSFP